MATKLKVQRVRRDLSARALAEMVDTRQQTISKIETGAWSVSPELARRIAAAMNLPLSTLFEERPGAGAWKLKKILWARTEVVK